MAPKLVFSPELGFWARVTVKISRDDDFREIYSATVSLTEPTTNISARSHWNFDSNTSSEQICLEGKREFGHRRRFWSPQTVLCRLSPKLTDSLAQNRSAVAQNTRKFLAQSLTLLTRARKVTSLSPRLVVAQFRRFLLSL